MNLDELPDINFVEKDVETILSEIVQGYEDAYFEQTGKKKILYPGDPVRIFLYSQALREYQLRQLVDYSAKQNLLKYAENNYLEHKAGDRGVNRLSASKATVPIKFVFSAPLPEVNYISAGIRVTPGDNIFFEVPEITEVKAGLSEITIIMKCTKAGTIGNDFLAGQINTLVDPIPFVASVANTEKSQGGTEEEDDDSLRERAWLVPESYSVAGPEGAYIFWTKSFSTSVEDVIAISPSAGVVEVYALLEDGEIPEQSFLDDLLEYLSAKERRPLTDNVSVLAPTIVDYDIDLTYYISSDNATSASTIQTAVNTAIEEYKLWQRSKIGRDINPDELIHRMKAVGAKRIALTSPLFTSIGDSEVANCENFNVSYGGLENG